MGYIDIQDLGFRDENEAALEIVRLNNKISRLQGEMDRYRNALVKIMSSAATALDTE